MRRLILGAIGVVMLLLTGCVTKGPYYIYGDYIEDLQEEGVPAEETPVPAEKTPAKPTPHNASR